MSRRSRWSIRFRLVVRGCFECYFATEVEVRKLGGGRRRKGNVRERLSFLLPIEKRP